MIKMCEECGCEQPDESSQVISLNTSVMVANNTIAHDIWHELRDKDVFCVNILGSPGSGKTSIIEGITTYISPQDIAVIQGDLESDVDKIRLSKANIETVQINTHSGCHLNAQMIKTVLGSLNLSGKKFLLIENVGNLVCPAGIKLGQHIDIVISSTTEGSDKPKKYPHIFRNAKMVVISKIDIAKAVDFNEKQYTDDITSINPQIKLYKTSSKNPESFEAVAKYLLHQRDHMLEKDHH